ncbi:MAG: glycosyltransferase family 2 protein [Candidatus Omnitrophota bacterium]
MKISILIPVYNEFKTIKDVIELVRSVDISKEIILVDDCSTDGTRELLRESYGDGREEIRIFYHAKNGGKGAAIRTALSKASGDYVIAQDADMEYSPQDIKKLFAAAEKTRADAVYGSRFLETWKVTSFPHFFINWFLTALTNIFFGGSLTDMETCYKMVKTGVIRSLDLRAERFEIEPEITSKLLRKGCKIEEVPISYRGRGYDEGKKISWRDGVEAVFVIFKLKFQG